MSYELHSYTILRIYTPMQELLKTLKRHPVTRTGSKHTKRHTPAVQGGEVWGNYYGRAQWHLLAWEVNTGEEQPSRPTPTWPAPLLLSPQLYSPPHHSAMCSCFASSASLLKVFHMASVSGVIFRVSKKAAALGREGAKAQEWVQGQEDTKEHWRWGRAGEGQAYPVEIRPVLQPVPGCWLPAQLLTGCSCRHQWLFQTQ